MFKENTFIHYQVQLAFANHSQSVKWQANLLTPHFAWAKVDQPFWADLEKQMTNFNPELGISIQVKPMAQTTSLYYFETTSFTSMTERRTWLSDLAKQFGIRFKPLNSGEYRLVHNLAGRKLLLAEVLSVWHQAQELEEVPVRSFTEFHQPVDIHSQLCTLQQLYLQGFFDWYAGIGQSVHHADRATRDKVKPFCRRCGYGQDKTPSSLLNGLMQLLGLGESEGLIQVDCQRCGQENCYYCPRCIEMGRVKACQPLLIWTPDPSVQLSTSIKRHKKHVPYQWTGQLSPAQQKVSNTLFNFVHVSKQGQGSIPTEQSLRLSKSNKGDEHPSKEFLIWAVCGAGKTEILYETIHHSLLKGEKILITSPRRDVILELAPRLKAAFPKTIIRTLYAESKEKFLAGELFLATTHQTLRFQHFFDLVIIDEEDAFPYHHDPLLPYAVEQAKKPNATTVYLTATPRQEMIRQLETGRLAYTLLSKRYHGHPLAVPVIQPIGQWRKQMEKGSLLTPLLQYVIHLARQERFGYLFVPHVADLLLVKRYLQERVIPYLLHQSQTYSQTKTKAYLQQMNIETVHAQHPERTAIVQRFRQQKIHILLTTTILERGVTIPFSDVAVLGSDDPVFDTAALIQIAGRVGRKPEDPVGHVWFFPESRTNAQLRCIEQIKEWNKY